MKHICYFYIFNFRSIQNLGISLDARYTYEMDEEQKVLTVRKNPKYIDGFWPEGIESLSAIVGENGTGKTTFLETMLSVLSGGNRKGLIDTLIVYDEGKGRLRAYTSVEGYSVIFEGNDILDKSLRPKAPIVKPFYYSSGFRPFSMVHTPGEGEIGDAYNASDTWRLIRDLQDYGVDEAKKKKLALEDYFDAYKAQDNNRIAQLLCDNELRSYLPECALPRYVVIVPNISGSKMMKKEGSNFFLDLYSNLGEGHTKEGYLSWIILNIFRNLEAETRRKSNYITETVLEKWERFYDGTQKLTDSLEAFKNEVPQYQNNVDDIREVASFLMQACKYDNNADKLYIDLEHGASKKNVHRLMKMFQNPNLKMARYFDLQYARDTYGITQLSAGELDMLKLCSRLYDAILLHKASGKGHLEPKLILIDEAENSYHPEWQRQFVDILLQFMNALYRRLDKKRKFQIILTTHSPILLSDIPRMCINYLERGDARNIVLSKIQPETFGANVFELYRYAFFMKDGLVGAYAYNKINEIRETIEQESALTNEDVEDLTNRIEMIGDDAIKHYLLSLLEQKYKLNMVAYYKRKIEELEEA